MIAEIVVAVLVIKVINAASYELAHRLNPDMEGGHGWRKAVGWVLWWLA